MLYAGITTLNFKYSYHQFNKIIKVIVTNLKQRSQSAGNFIYYLHLNLYTYLFNAPYIIKDSEKTDESTSETLRESYERSTPLPLHLGNGEEAAKKISIHVPTHLKPESDTAFGHYLAGLIEGDGHFSNTPQLVLVFNELDASLAYYIKGRIGFGNVYKVKNKKAVILVIANRQGLIKVLSLINGKIRSEKRLDQIKNNILLNPYFNMFSNFSINTNADLNNHWLTGFSDADASFQIKILTRKHRRPEVRLNFQIDQKNNDLLILIKNFLGGNVGHRKSQNTYYFGSTSFASARNVIKYFDQFPLLSSKHVNYLKWRKAYILIQNKDHLTETGLNIITKLKKTMNRNNEDNS